MITVVRLTLHEAVRRRLVWALLLMTIVVVGVTGWGFERLVTLAHEKGALDSETRAAVAQILVLVAFMFSMVMAMTAVLFGAPALAADVESGLVLGLLSRPIRRRDLVVGRWLGLSLLVLGYAALSGGAEMAACAVLTGWVPPAPLLAILYLGTEGIVVMTLALLLSARLSVMAGGAITVVAFGLVWLVGILARLGDALGIDTLVQAGTISRLLLPTDTLWRGVADSLQPSSALLAVASGAAGTRTASTNGFDAVFVGSPPTGAELAWVVVWLALLALGAVRLFRSRDL